VNKTGISLALLTFVWAIFTPQIANAIDGHDIEFIQDITGGAAGPLSLPSDVAVDKSHIYIVDGGNHRVVVFNHDGEYQYTIGSEGEGPGQFSGPVGIDAGADGRIYIADLGNYRIQIFDIEGTFLSSFQVKSEGKLIRPVDVAAGGGNEIFVTGNDNHKVMVFTPYGQLLREWGGSGLDQGRFRYPATLTFLRDARLAVVDVLNTRMQIFERTGRFSIEVGEWGVLPGQLFRPKGVAVDNEGNLYISDSYMNIIQVFSDTGVFMHVLEVSGGSGTFETPVGMTIDDQNRLYVAEMLKNKVSIFWLEP
jgi:DNA-binding beta-propeller fold protein YncE